MYQIIQIRETVVYVITMKKQKRNIHTSQLLNISFRFI